MHAADAARCKDLNAGAMCNPHRRGHRGCAVPTLRHGYCEIAGAEFFDVVTTGDLLDLLLIESDTEPAIEDRDCGRCYALLAQDLFHPLRSFKVLRPWQS